MNTASCWLTQIYVSSIIDKKYNNIFYLESKTCTHKPIMPTLLNIILLVTQWKYLQKYIHTYFYNPDKQLIIAL